ncbi:MAG: tRNA lysidine(34) synthetase TilS [bacterium]
MYKAIFDNLLKNNIDIRGKRIVAGVSGGPDSLLLFMFLLDCRKKHKVCFKVLHMNHHERESADYEEKFVKDLCKRHSVEIELFSDDSVDSQVRREKGFEMAARESRRRMFVDEAERFMADFIMTGHNLDDSVETFLINIERGTGIRGIASNRLINKAFVKPLIFLKKAQISDFLDKKRIMYITDETNSDESITRNRIRRRIIPVLDESLKNGINNFTKFFENTIGIVEMFDYIIEHDLHIVRNRNPFILDISKILYYNNKLRKNLLYYILSREFYVDASLIERIDALALSKKPNISFYEKNLSIIKSYDEIRFSREAGSPIEERAALILDREREFNGYTLKIEKTDSPKEKQTGKYCMYFPFEAGKEFHVRVICSKDEFIPFGMAGKKRVSRFLMGMKVPLEERKRIPILVNDREEILAVGSLRRTELYRLNKQKRCYKYYAEKN